MTDADEFLDPDWMQNRNRQSKAPLAIHGDHDVVVTPARPVDEPDRSHTSRRSSRTSTTR